MTCERYWRDGIVLVERGLDDPHRDGCIDCTRGHASRRQLVEALPLVGAGRTGDPHWQAKVWRRIDGERGHAPWRWRWQLASGLAVACVVALWIGLGRGDAIPRYDIVRGANAVAMRSGSAGEAHVDDTLRVTVGKTSDVWIYRDGRLALQCRAGQLSDVCKANADGMIADLVLSRPVVYQVILVEAPAAPPRGNFDEDRATLATAGAHYDDTYRVTVR